MEKNGKYGLSMPKKLKPQRDKTQNLLLAV